MLMRDTALMPSTESRCGVCCQVTPTEIFPKGSVWKVHSSQDTGEVLPYQIKPVVEGEHPRHLARCVVVSHSDMFEQSTTLHSNEANNKKWMVVKQFAPHCPDGVIDASQIQGDVQSELAVEFASARDSRDVGPAFPVRSQPIRFPYTTLDTCGSDWFVTVKQAPHLFLGICWS